MDEAATLGTLIFDNSVGGLSNSYAVAESSSIATGLVFNNGSSQAVIDDEGGNQLISAPVGLQSPTTITMANAADTLTFSNSISGNMTINGPGAVAFNQSFSNVEGGDTITVASGGNIVLGGSMPVTTDLVVNGDATFPSSFSFIGALNGLGTVNVKSGVVVQGGGSFAGTVAGSGGLEVLGGTLSLSGVNTYTGSTSVEEGSLELTGAASLASSSMEVAKNTTLILDASLQNPSLSNVVVDGTATFKCSAATFVGYLVVDSDGAISLSSTALTLDGGGFNGPLTGNGSLTVAGSVTVDCSLTYSGTTTVSSGTLELDWSNSLASNTLNVSAGGTLFVNKYASFSASTNLTNNGTVNITNASQTISTLNGSGTMSLNSGALTIGNGGTFSGSITGKASVTLGGGILNLSGPISASAVTDAATTTLNINGSVSGSPNLVSNGLTNFAANSGTSGPVAVTLGSLSIGAAGKMTVNSAGLHVNRSVVEVGSLTFADTPAAPGGLLNLMDNDLIVHSGNLANIISEIAAASDEGLWNGGGGITSSVAAAGGNTTLAAVLNDDGTGTHTALYSTFDKQTVIDSDVLVKYTFAGDADLSGTVNGSDYTLIDNGFNSQGSADPLSGWRNGDFNYDGVINGDDYILIDNSFNTEGSTSFAASSAGPAEMIAGDTEIIATPAVPEPSSLGLIGIGAVALLGKRRRR